MAVVTPRRTAAAPEGCKTPPVTPPVPTILALGGSTTPMSASERALRIASEACAAAGARVEYLTGRQLMLPIYDTESTERTSETLALLDAVRRADGLIVSSPGYHGGISGMLKNALDYVEDLRRDERPYFERRPVGLIGVAHGWQTAVGTLHQLRQIVHSLRGWPTPLGVAINDSSGLIRTDGSDSDPHIVEQLQLLGEQVTAMAVRLGPDHPTAE